MIYMIIYNVHNNAHPIVMKRFHHLLHLSYADCAVIGVGRIGAFRYIEVYRVITPVVLRLCQGFVCKAKVINRKQMNMGHAQILDMIQTGGNAICIYSACFC